MLESLIRSKTARKLLTTFLTNPENKFYIRQLERLMKEPVSAVRRELNKLEESGLLLSKNEARVKYYWVNRDYPIFDEIKKIIFKTQAIGDSLRELISKIPKIKVAFIYGSVAGGKEKATSDVDLMVVGDVDSMKLHSKMNEVEERIGRAVNYTLMNENELRNKKTEFIKRVLKEKKIFLIGSDSELRKLA